MNELPSSPDSDQSPASHQPGRMGLGTVTVLVLFLGIISAMCLGAILIVVVLAFR